MKDPLVIIADVTKEDDAKRIVADTAKHYRQLDVLVNSAGICDGASILAENTMKAYDQVMATNLRAIVHLTHLAAPHIIKTKGNIVNISSVSALRTISKEGFAYNTAKAGLDHFTRSIAAELASSGVRVNAVNPGMVKTDLLTNMGLPEKQRESVYEFMKTFSEDGFPIQKKLLRLLCSWRATRLKQLLVLTIYVIMASRLKLIEFD